MQSSSPQISAILNALSFLRLIGPFFDISSSNIQLCFCKVTPSISQFGSSNEVVLAQRRHPIPSILKSPLQCELYPSMCHCLTHRPAVTSVLIMFTCLSMSFLHPTIVFSRTYTDLKLDCLIFVKYFFKKKVHLSFCIQGTKVGKSFWSFEEIVRI